MKASNWYLSLPMATIITVIGLGAASVASNEPSSSTPQQVFDSMRDSFQAKKAKGVHARYQWELSGPKAEDGGTNGNAGPIKMEKEKTNNRTAHSIPTTKDGLRQSKGNSRAKAP